MKFSRWNIVTRRWRFALTSWKWFYVTRVKYLLPPSTWKTQSRSVQIGWLHVTHFNVDLPDFRWKVERHKLRDSFGL